MIHSLIQWCVCLHSRAKDLISSTGKASLTSSLLLFLYYSYLSSLCHNSDSIPRFPRYLCPVYRDLQLLIVTLFIQFTMLLSILMPCSVFDYWKSCHVFGKQDAFNLSECHSSCSHHVIVSFLTSGVSGYNFFEQNVFPSAKKWKIIYLKNWQYNIFESLQPHTYTRGFKIIMVTTFQLFI